MRKKRGLSAAVVAGLAGISRDYLLKLERGARRFDRRGLIQDIAAALRCSPVQLTGEPYEPTDPASADAMAAIPQIELALLDCTLDDVPDIPHRPVDELVRAVRQASEHRTLARYDLAGAELGYLLTELHVVAATTADGAERQAALTSLVEACDVASVIPWVLGWPTLAVKAAERGLEAAQRLEATAWVGWAQWRQVLALIRAGAVRRAESTLLTVLNELAGADPTAPDTAAAEAYGMTHLTRALLAARDGRSAVVNEHLREATDIARRTGERNTLYQNFGPTNVAVWRLSIGVELQEGGRVYERAHREQVDLSLLSPLRASAWHLDLARAAAQEDGKLDADAFRHLQIADQMAPQRWQHDPLTRELAAELDMRARRRDHQLEWLRTRFRIT